MKRDCLIGWICICQAFLFGCISPYEPEEVESIDGLLVVEGIIQPSGTLVRLSRTQKLVDEGPVTGVESAAIKVLDRTGTVMGEADPFQIGDSVVAGTYIISKEMPLKRDSEYALHIRLGEKEYKSEYVSLIQTPEIDKIEWVRNQNDGKIEIQVSTHDPENRINYFKWEYEEDWEIRSQYFAEFKWNPVTKQTTRLSPDGDNLYYCWVTRRSNRLLLGNTEKLSESAIRNQTISSINRGDARLSLLYSILVRQYGLDKNAYDYFNNLKNNVENSGDLFAPQPSEMKGNITCLTHPEEPVIGYVCASQPTVSRLFIELQEVPDMAPLPFDCGDEVFYREQELGVAYLYDLAIRSYDWTNQLYSCMSRRCVDCTANGGTKMKPVFWPNNHH